MLAKENKKSAVSRWVLIVYSVFLILFIIYGNNASKFVTKMVGDFIGEQFTSPQITDVTIVDKLDGYVTGNYYQLEFDVETKKDKPYKLKFKSSNTDVLTVSSEGKICGRLTDGVVQDSAEIIVTADTDPVFEKHIPIKIVRDTPNDFEFRILNAYSTVKNAYVGEEIFMYCNKTLATNKYSEKNPIITCEKGYIEYIEGYKYKVVNPCDGFTVTATFGNVSKTYTIDLLPAVDAVDFDEIFIKNTRVPNYTGEEIFYNKEKIYVRPRKNGKDLRCGYTVTFSDDKKAEISEYGQTYFRQSGDLTLTVTLENGFSKSVDLKIRNIFDNAPTLSGNGLDDNFIYIGVKQYESYKFTFNDTATYKTAEMYCDDRGVKVSYYGGTGFGVYGRKAGEYPLTVVFDDGFERVELNYTIIVSKELETLANRVKELVPKLGHFVLFIILGIVAFFFIKYNRSAKKWVDVTRCVAIGLLPAVITELGQIFIEGRTASILDVFLDFGGYVLGFLIVGFIIKNKEKKEIAISSDSLKTP